MKFVSWNVNGLRACVNKGFLDTFHSMNADFFCLQETKLQEGQIDLDLPGYEQYWCYAEKKGYSGTAIFTKHTPLSVTYGVGVEELDTEGRLITLEYEEFYLVCCYTPNAQRELARIDHRLRWEEALQEYLAGLDAKKPVIYCGDLNVAHKEVDLKNPSANRGNAGFSDEERGAFSALLDRGFTDSFRHLYPDVTGAYSWWSYMFNARKNNAGWRIDYFVVSDRLADNIHDATIHPDVMGSDHCPVGLDLNITCNGSIWTTDATMPCEKPEKKADGDSSAGHIRKLVPVAVSLVLTAALLIPVFTITKKASPKVTVSTQPTTTGQPTTQSTEQSVEQTTVKKPKMILDPLIVDIVHHSDPLTHRKGTTGPTDSLIRNFYNNGKNRWELVPSNVTFNEKANFFVELIFNKKYHFTDSDYPTITIDNSDTTYLHYYYDDNYRVVGCIVAGFAESDFQLEVTANYANKEFRFMPIQSVIPIHPSPDPASMTADELLHYLKYSSILSNSINSASFGLVDYNVYAQELATRPEAISILLYDYQYYGDFTSVTYLLLTSELFQSKMDPLERKQFNELVDKKYAEGDFILYGSLTPIPT